MPSILPVITLGDYLSKHARSVSRWFHLQEEMKLRADAETIEGCVAEHVYLVFQPATRSLMATWSSIHKKLIALG